MHRLVTIIALMGMMAIAHRADADVTITSFENFTSDNLYPSWNSKAVTSTPTNYIVTATGYGSNYKYIGSPAIDGTGCTQIELDVTLSGPPAANSELGPIVTLIDGDGTSYSYRWYGQTLGHHVLTMPVNSPTVVEKPGSVSGLDLAKLQHLHLSVDPGHFGKSGAYTIAWNKLRLIGGNSAPAKP